MLAILLGFVFAFFGQSKINKRSWVLHECLERVPENVDAAKELLQYGLKGTDLEALVAIGKGEDGGRFVKVDHWFFLLFFKKVASCDNLCGKPIFKTLLSLEAW